VGDFVDLFSTLNRKAKIYQRKESLRATHGQTLGRLIPTLPEPHAVPHPPRKAPAGKMPLRELTERTLLQHLGLVAVLVNEHGDILYLHGRTGLYLEPAPGEAALNIIKMAREGLRRDLSIALNKAVAQRETVRHPGLRVKTNGHFTTANLTVRPVEADLEAARGASLFLVMLEEVTEATPERPRAVAPRLGNTEADARIVALEKELRAKEEYLQSANEELETSNEELQSSNEEMQSVNEELQSTNEELETSKEELQSVNEELATVNAELQTKVADLSQTNNDMNNLLAGTEMGTIFVDHQQRIKRFTPAVTRVINLIQTDVGRPVGHIVSNLEGYDHLVGDVKAVLDTLIPKEVEVQSKTGVWYLLGIRPYRTLENVIEGAVITFVDITALKKAQAELRDSAAMRHLAVVVRDSRDAIVAQNLDGHILAWNPGAERMYGWSEAEALQRNIRDMSPENVRDAMLQTVKQLAEHAVLQPYRLQRLTKSGQIIEVIVTATALIDEAGQVYAIATTERTAAGNGAV
jgi:two-component system CheB/CheR fusion protein